MGDTMFSREDRLLLKILSFFIFCAFCPKKRLRTSDSLGLSGELYPGNDKDGI